MGFLDEVLGGVSGASGASYRDCMYEEEKNNNSEKKEESIYEESREVAPLAPHPPLPIPKVDTLPIDSRCPVDTLKPTAEPEKPLPAIQRYQVGDRVRYAHQTALNIREGVIVEAKAFRTTTWYRIKDGDTLRWVGEAHIQGRAL